MLYDYGSSGEVGLSALISPLSVTLVRVAVLYVAVSDLFRVFRNPIMLLIIQYVTRLLL